MAELHQLKGSRCGQNGTDREFRFPRATGHKAALPPPFPRFSVLVGAELQQQQLHPRQAVPWGAGTSLRDKFNLENQPAEWHAEQSSVKRGTLETFKNVLVHP